MWIFYFHHNNNKGNKLNVIMQNMIGCQELLKMKIIFFQIKRERKRKKIVITALLFEYKY